MVWALFLEKENKIISALAAKQNNFKYQKIITDYLFPFITSEHQAGNVYEQDSVSIHPTRSKRDCLGANYVNVIPWPAYSPDLNPIERLWEVSAQRV